MPEYNVTLTQDTGASLLLRVSPNNYADYSLDGTIWYPFSVVSAGEGGTTSIVVDNVSIKLVDGVLTAVPEIPSGGAVGDVLTRTSSGWDWSQTVSIGYGDGLQFIDGTVSVHADSSTITIDNGILAVTRPIPPGGVNGQVLTTDGASYAWKDPEGVYTFIGNIVLNENTNTVSLNTGTNPGQLVVVGTDGFIDSGLVNVAVYEPDGVTITLTDNKLTAISELPSGGIAGQVLGKTDTGVAWVNDAAGPVYTFGDGLVLNEGTLAVSVDVGTVEGKIPVLDKTRKIPVEFLEVTQYTPDNVTIVADDNNILSVVIEPELPEGGSVGQVLGRTATGVAWVNDETGAAYVFGSGIDYDKDSLTVAVAVDGSTVQVVDNKLSVVNALPTPTAADYILSTDADLKPIWVENKPAYTFGSGFAIIEGASTVYVDTGVTPGKIVAVGEDGKIDSSLIPDSQHDANITRFVTNTIDGSEVEGTLEYTISTTVCGMVEYAKIVGYDNIDTLKINIPTVSLAADEVYVSTLWLDTSIGSKSLALETNANFSTGAHRQLLSGYENTLHQGITKIEITQLPTGESFANVVGYWGSVVYSSLSSSSSSSLSSSSSSSSSLSSSSSSLSSSSSSSLSSSSSSSSLSSSSSSSSLSSSSSSSSSLSSSSSSSSSSLSSSSSSSLSSSSSSLNSSSSSSLSSSSSDSSSTISSSSDSSVSSSSSSSSVVDVTAELANNLTLTALQDYSEVSLNAVGSPTTSGLRYRKNVEDSWSTYTVGQTISLSEGEYVQFSNTENTLSTGSAYLNFSMSGKVAASGNIQSMLNYSDSCKTSCYYRLFRGCTSLTTAPELPATTLAANCYGYMFSGCTNLVEASKLPATTLVSGCYQSMFEFCFKLSKLSVGFTSWGTNLAVWPTSNWVAYVPTEDGEFSAPEALTRSYGVHNIPNGWDTSGDKQDNLRLTARQAGSTVALNVHGDFTGVSGVDIYPIIYKTKSTELWGIYEPGSVIQLTNVGDYVDFYGRISMITRDDARYLNFVLTGEIVASGSVHSLVAYDTYSIPTAGGRAYDYLFKNCAALVQAPSIPHVTYAAGYKSMFEGCTGLTVAPTLSADSLHDSCYENMFKDCTSLASMPVINVKEMMTYHSASNGTTTTVTAVMSEACCRGMFSGCTKLTTLTNLGTIAEHTYGIGPRGCENMFAGCTALVDASGMSLGIVSGEYGYAGMFTGCTKLETPPGGELTLHSFRNSSYDLEYADYACYQMFKDCAALRSAPIIKPSGSAEENSTYGYANMFENCSSLEYIFVDSRFEWSDTATSNWVLGVTSDCGEFVSANTELAREYGTSRIPASWDCSSNSAYSGESSETSTVV